MNKLNRREQLLIYVLACVLVGLFGFYFVVRPSYANFQVVAAQSAEAQFTQDAMSVAIDGIPATMQARDAANAKLVELKTPFSPKLPNEGVDSLLTQLCLGYSLAPKILAVESNQLQSVSTFAEYTSGNATAATTEGTDATSDTTGATENTDNVDNTNGGTQTWTSVVSMELTGSQTNFYRLLDGVAARQDMIISKFAIAPIVSADAITTTNGTTTTNVVYSGFVPKLDGGDITIKITFTVYMVEK